MAGQYEIHFSDPAGNRIALLHPRYIDYGRVVNGAGWFDIAMPQTFDRSLLRVDGIIEIWRAPGYNWAWRIWANRGRVYALPRKVHLSRQLSGLLRRIKTSTNKDGATTYNLIGKDVNELLDTRIVAYAAGSAQADMTDNAGDIIKAVATDNLAGDAAAARDLTTPGFTVQGDLSDGASITKAFSWRDLDRVARDLCDASAGNGTDLFWEIVPTGAAAFQLQTFTTQPGMDRTTSGSNPVIFGLEWGNLENPILDEDYQKEVTYVYAGGRGQGSDREIVEVEDAPRSARSVWGRREAFTDARNERSTAGVTAKANARLREGEPYLRFTGNLLDAPVSVYGYDWEFGDKVTCTYEGRDFDGVVNAVKIHVNESGDESITAKIEVEDKL